MLSRILIDGYKSIDREELELRNFTLLSGVNSAGKSSVIQALLYMIQFQRQAADDNKETWFLDLAKFVDIRNNIQGKREIFFELDNAENNGKVDTTKLSILELVENIAPRIKIQTGDGCLKYVCKHNVIYLSVERIGVQKSYDLNVEAPEQIGARGEYAYSYLAAFGQDILPEKNFVIRPEEIGMSLNNQVNYWLEYVMGFHIRTNIIFDVDQVVVTYSNAGTNRYYRGQNVGTGITYISMLIIAGLSCKKGDVLIVENPEIHLHPRAQSRFMEFLAHLSNQGLQIILETHSDHIYNGMRKCIKNGRLSKEKIAAYFLELDETMQTKISKIHFNDQGAEENHPYGMFDQFDDDLDELLGL